MRVVMEKQKLEKKRTSTPLAIVTSRNFKDFNAETEGFTNQSSPKKNVKDVLMQGINQSYWREMSWTIEKKNVIILRKFRAIQILEQGTKSRIIKVHKSSRTENFPIKS